METKMRMVKFGMCLLVFVTACNSRQLLSPRPEGVVSTPVPTVVEPGLAYGEPCKPPCWRGIIPGKTTKSEAARAMAQLQSSGWASDITEGLSGYIIYPLSRTLTGYIRMGWENDVISNIAGQVIFHYPVETMLEQFGEPEGLYIGKKITATTSCEEWKQSDPQTYSWSVEAIYPNKGLVFSIAIPEGGEGLMCAQWKVSEFCYYPPLLLQEALNNNYLATLCWIDGLKGKTEEDLVKWHGFGSGY